MERTWTNVGSEYNSTEGQKTSLSGMFNRLSWETIEQGKEVAFCPGEAIKQAIRQLSIPKASHFAISNELAPYGLVAVRGHYKNGMAEVFIIDEGSSLTVLASDFYLKQKEFKKNGKTD